MRFSTGRVRVSILVVLCLLLTGGSLRAQSGTTSISGRVTDPQGSVVPGATVTTTNRATAASRTVITNESGLYQVSALTPGVYDLTIELSGFKTLKFEKVELRVDTPAR